MRRSAPRFTFSCNFPCRQSVVGAQISAQIYGDGVLCKIEPHVLGGRKQEIFVEAEPHGRVIAAGRRLAEYARRGVELRGTLESVDESEVSSADEQRRRDFR